MARLNPAQLRTRLAFDHSVIRGLTAADHVTVRAFADGRHEREVTLTEGEAGLATRYLAEYRFPILTGPGPTTDRALVRFDLLAGGNYPFSEPVVEVLSRPRPWTPHVHPSSGAVCLGGGWRRAQGRMLAAHLVVHVMHLLNFDEPAPDAGYSGWNGEAISYWRGKLGLRPLHPGLPYPVLPAEVTHRVAAPGTEFVALSVASDADDGFRVLFSDDDDSDAFAPLGRVL
ncbi:MAG: hypothetical protein JWM10_4158 [Myxococcaceae bacterium]|nr:hypothetical protein [Myxococcaceae bacterium]